MRHRRQAPSTVKAPKSKTKKPTSVFLSSIYVSCYQSMTPEPDAKERACSQVEEEAQIQWAESNDLQLMDHQLLRQTYKEKPGDEDSFAIIFKYHNFDPQLA